MLQCPMTSVNTWSIQTARCHPNPFHTILSAFLPTSITNWRCRQQTCISRKIILGALRGKTLDLPFTAKKIQSTEKWRGRRWTLSHRALIRTLIDVTKWNRLPRPTYPKMYSHTTRNISAARDRTEAWLSHVITASQALEITECNLNSVCTRLRIAWTM